MRQEIVFNVKNLRITKTGNIYATEGIWNVFDAVFNFVTSDWNGIVKTAVFENTDGEKEKCLLINDRCEIPDSFFNRSGVCYVSVFAGNFMVTNKVPIIVANAGYKISEEDGEAKNYFEQLLRYFDATNVNVDKYAKLAEKFAVGIETDPESMNYNARYFSKKAEESIGVIFGYVNDAKYYSEQAKQSYSHVLEDAKNQIDNYIHEKEESLRGKSAYQYAQDGGYTGTESEFAQKLSAEYIAEETDPNVPGWAKQKQKPDYTATEVGADPSGTAEAKVSAHNTSADAHNDIRLLVQRLVDRLNALADSDDTTLDQMREIVAYIKNNKSLIDAVTTGKVSTTDIIDNLTTNVSNKPLSEAQGVALKALIDGIMGNIGTYVEDYLKENPITDSSVKEWAKKELGSGLIVSEDGRLSVDTADSVEKDNTKPVTSGAVFTVLGNVEALLSML